MPATFFHFIPFGLEKTVIDSQLVIPALKLRNEGLMIRLLVMEDIRTWWGLFSRHQRTMAQDRLKGIPVTFLPRMPRNFLFLNTITLLIALWPQFIRGHRVVIHARGLQGSNYLLPIKRVYPSLRIICDVRGLEAEEYIYAVMKRRGTMTVFQKWWGSHLSRLSQKVLRRSDKIFCVSRAMKNHLREESGQGDDTRWEWIPCCVDADRFSSALQSRAEKRRQLGLKDRLVVVFSGAHRGWQLPQKSVEIFKLIQTIHPQAFFLCLSPDVRDFEEEIRAAGLPPASVRVQKVKFDEMPDFLAAGDVGLLLRENHPLNSYACPTKFAEYLACGLHVISTTAIHDVAQVIQDELVGTLVDLEGEPTQRTDLLRGALRVSELEMTRIERSVSTAIRLYDWSHYIPTMKKCYLQLAESK